MENNIPKEVAIACTGGGIRTAVNIGVIRGLEELGIKITAISGASLGSCVAVLYSLGYTPKEILNEYKQSIDKFRKFSVLDYILAFPRLFFTGGFKDPKKLCEIFEDISIQKGVAKMSDISMPVVIPGLDVTKKETMYYSSKSLERLVYYSDRNIWEAIKSSCCFPFVFKPNKVLIDNEFHYIMDGGITINTTTVPLKQFSDYIIGIGTTFYEGKVSTQMNMVRMIKYGFKSMRRSSLNDQKAAADLWLNIDVGKVGVFSKIEYADYLEELGYKAVMNAFQKEEVKQEAMNIKIGESK